MRLFDLPDPLLDLVGGYSGPIPEITDPEWSRFVGTVLCGQVFKDFVLLNSLAQLENDLIRQLVEEDDDRSEKILTQQQKLILLVCLTYGKMEIPAGVTVERVIEFFHQIVGGSKQNLRTRIYKLAKVKSKQQLKPLVADIKLVIRELSLLGRGDLVHNLESEIEFMIDEVGD